jgi:hypothetical protein
MKVEVLFPKDSKRPGRGFRKEVFEIPQEILREMFETYRQTKNVNRAIAVPCEWVAGEAARRWCRAVGRSNDEDCINEYLDKQGERIIQQCEPSARRWIAETAECLKRCEKDRNCLKDCIKKL